MPDNKKYYYLKLKDTFFDSAEIKLIEAQENGYIYSNLYLKMTLMALKYDGRLVFNEKLPYDLPMLATITGIPLDNVRVGVKILMEYGLVEVLETGVMYLSEIQLLIGHGSTEAERKSTYRKRIEAEKKQGGQCPGQNPPELELELELELKKEREREKEKAPVIPFNPIETPNTGLSDRIQATIEYWNELAKDHDCIPHYRYNMFQIKDMPGVKRTMGAVTDEEACHAIDTYIEIFENTSDYKCFPNGYSFEGFIKSGVDQYCDSAKPWTRCAIEQGSDPRVKFKSKIWDD